MPKSCADPLAHIEEEIEAVQTLLLLVENERQTLLGIVDADELDRITAKKMATVSQMSDLVHFRNASLAQQGYHPDEAGMREWLTDFPTHASRERWEFLLCIAHQIKTVNQANGQLIARLLNQNQAILGVFGIATQGLGLYGSDGRPQSARVGYLK